MSHLHTRRNFVTTMAGASLAGLSGCCASSPAIVERPPVTGQLVNFTPLAPRRINNSLRLTTQVIDPHCHIFNASDIQVGGFLSGPIANQLPDSIRWLVKGLAPVVEFIAKNIALSAYAEMQKLDELQTTLLTAGLSNADSTIDTQIQQQREWLATEMAAEIKGTKLERKINNHLSELAANNAGFSAGFSKDYLLRTFNQEDELSGDTAEMLRDASGSPDRAGGIFAFVGHMLSPRYHNLRKYQRAFSTDNESIGIDTCLASLVDFDYWMGSCDHPVSSLRDQIILHQRISSLSDGFMQPIVAYNPWTDIKENNAALNLVIDAVKNRGYRGVKIYPPVGYFPFGNDNNPNYPGDGKRPNLRELDNKLNALFEECRSLDVPVMAHSSESLGRLPSHDKLGGPSGWRAFFNQPQNRLSRVNLGHVGGETGGAGDQANWTAQFVELMSSADNLYGDLGFWDKLVDGNVDAANRLKDLLVQSVTTLSGEQTTAADRLMFGTDWFMISRNSGWKTYATRFQHALRGIGISDETLEKIFSSNAKKLFKL